MRNRWMSFVLCLTVASCVVPDVETFEPGHDSGGSSDSGPDVSAKDSASDQQAMPEGSRDVAQQDALIDKGSTGTGDDDAPSEVIDAGGGSIDTGAPPVEAGECSTSDTRCGADNTVETCVDSYWKQTAKCTGITPCAPRVRARRVQPGLKRCSDAVNLERCNTSGQWEPDSTCPTGNPGLPRGEMRPL